jgi:hypothetical protein
MKIINSFQVLCKELDNSYNGLISPNRYVLNKLYNFIGDDLDKFSTLYIECSVFNPTIFENQAATFINLSFVIIALALNVILSPNNFIQENCAYLYPAYFLVVCLCAIIFICSIAYRLIVRIIVNRHMLKWRNYILFSLQSYAKEKNWDIPKDFVL